MEDGSRDQAKLEVQVKGMIHAYAPTSSYDAEAVDSFYDNLKYTLNKVNTRNAIVLSTLSHERWFSFYFTPVCLSTSI